MPRRLLRLVSTPWQDNSRPSAAPYVFSVDDVVWAMGSFCALNRKPFDAGLLTKQFPPPYNADSFIHAGRALGFKIKRKECKEGTSQEVGRLNLPCLVVMEVQQAIIDVVDQVASRTTRPALVVQVTEEHVILFEAGSNVPKTLTPEEFESAFTGTAFQLALATLALKDPDGAQGQHTTFGFKWFIPELLKHRKVWRDVLIASLIIQLLALGTPLFTQVVIDKVVVHRTESTLIVIAIGLGVFMLFSALLSWVRQYLVLHTGNRVDAVLGSAVFNHLFKLPPRYFEHRPTGVIAARLHGVETIREFVASAAVTLTLDFPFLLIFVGIMFYYSVMLSLVALSLISCIVLLSLIMAPIFRTRLNQQFLLSARNQAFITEYVSGLETVKSLQMEPQLSARYGDYLADYLQAGFSMKQIANTYNVVANGLEQLMSLLILVVGAYTVMHDSTFTIGMLIAFQMFAGRVSQPMLRIVGLWQQFQQANMSVQRLGDIMNAPTEPYSILPSRLRENRGSIDIENLSFRYGDNLPYLYQGFAMKVEPGKVVAIMGPSGSGKSTLAKLLQGFYIPADGQIKLDGNDIRYLSANELRHYFGVVPQETVLFSGTIYDNLLMANPHATFDQAVHACKMAEIHDTIEGLPQGYQTEIGERGVGLSGGQKQRMAIARALLKQPKILVFDEATSSLDSETAEHFAATINQLKGKVTMLFITHALPKSLLVDEVVQIGRKASDENGIQLNQRGYQTV
ncbi:peptidase domain-containing ABC transporter [Solimicrobium silvestre]|uniref:Cyclolysin secretion/processing ATP-binding protein CyaB n=1 Tax=Solimicrobium silvestre TaxID=2099400 RepID=A0A2S9GT11_9BURK|nr:peptidase domain-containing ABC transporter [Solimicrobium silvestre]PRC90841.1 ABC-type bacteriocin/lantibiotic exporter [Solimicrobium silvestre]